MGIETGRVPVSLRRNADEECKDTGRKRTRQDSSKDFLKRPGVSARHLHIRDGALRINARAVGR